MVKTRFAPSPTGAMHIGSLRTAVYAFALAKHQKGKFILRIEDTDKKREVEGSEKEIEETLKLFGLKWDEKFVQSERLKLYQAAAKDLVQAGHAFEKEGAIRIKIPKNEKISFLDFVLNKEVVWETNTLEDLVLLKSDGFPTYHLAVVVDDHAMGITHVLRGHDWLPSTPIHLLLYQFLGYDLPEIGHLTDILDPEGGKLSKRKGSTSVKGLLEEGYLPEAILNFVVLLGWAPKDNRELFTLAEFVKAFAAKGFQKANPVFNREKLDWFNGYYIRNIDINDLNNRIYDFYGGKYSLKKIAEVTPLVRERVKKLSEIKDFAGPVLDHKVNPEPLTTITPNYSVNISGATLSTLKNIDKWNLPNINEALKTANKNAGTAPADFYMDLRGTIFGKSITPPLNESLVIIGQDKTLKQVQKGIEKQRQK